MANVWRDNRLVYVMSTNTTGDDSRVCQRKEKSGSISTIPIPLITFHYNKYMGGVDIPDQFRSYRIAGNVHEGKKIAIVVIVSTHEVVRGLNISDQS